MNILRKEYWYLDCQLCKSEGCDLMECEASSDYCPATSTPLISRLRKSPYGQKTIYRRLRLQHNAHILSVVLFFSTICWITMTCVTCFSVSLCSSLGTRGGKLMSVTNHHTFTRRTVSGFSSAFRRDPSVLSRYHQSIRMMTSSIDNGAAAIVASPETTETTNADFSPMLEESSERIFSFILPEGLCVGLRLNKTTTLELLSPRLIKKNDNQEYSWIYNQLHPEEIEYGAGINEKNRLTFFLGRLAMREALRLENNIIPKDPILRDEHKRPKVPKGYLGSISHKGTTGVALICRDTTTKLHEDTQQPTLGIGIDIEGTSTLRPSIAKKVLTEREIDQLGQLEGMTKDEETLLRFSLKESLYKAMHPLICQYVGFKEAEVTPHADGTATVRLNINNGAHEKFGAITAHWRRLDCNKFFLSSVSVRGLY